MKSADSRPVPPEECSGTVRRLAGYLPILPLLLAVILRLPLLFSELQYDEIWTLANFTQLDCLRILTDVSLPNNHPVNTLVLKLLSGVFSEAPLLRSGVFLCGIAVVYLCGKCAEMFDTSKECSFAAQLLAAAMPPLIVYSVTARGYIFQLLGLQLCVLGLHRSVKSEHCDRYAIAAIAGGGTVAFLSVSSGVMFLFAVALGYLLLTPKARRFNASALTGGALLAFMAGAYYILLFNTLRSGQQWGEELSTFMDWINFASRTVSAQLPLFIIPWVLTGIIFLRKLRIIFALSLLPLLLALVTNGGPERVYLPLCITYTVIAAGGFSVLCQRSSRQRKAIISLLVICAAGNWFFPEPVWTVPSPAADMRLALAKMPEEILPVLPATAGLPAQVNAPELEEKLNSRIWRVKQLYILHCKNGEFNGADSSKSEQRMNFNIRGREIREPAAGYCYQLSPLSAPPRPGTVVFAVFPMTPPEEFLKYSGRKLRLNIWLNKSFHLYICEITEAEFPVNCPGSFYRLEE